MNALTEVVRVLVKQVARVPQIREILANYPALRNPPRTVHEHVDALERLGLIRTASLVRPHRNSI